jgi:N-acetylglucosaminyl-diphospho-decaprenol L-rhamnosyltransferase
MGVGTKQAVVTSGLEARPSTFGALDPSALRCEAAPHGHALPIAGRRQSGKPNCGQSKVWAIVVGYRNAEDIVGCLRALAFTCTPPLFDVIIVENGGAQAFNALCDALMEVGSPCLPVANSTPAHLAHVGVERQSFKLLRGNQARETGVHTLQMLDNLGYAGAINACIRPLLSAGEWHAIWILNPDTEPLPSALFELADYAATHSKGMVGSLVTTGLTAAASSNCGLKWNKFSARTTAVGPHAREERATAGGGAPMVDAASGASLYVTRHLIERIGLMDEQYFLYFEDLEWGCRANALNELGVARQSIVIHKGGTTIGSAETRSARSNLSVYLEFRNRILFVRQQYKGWLVWTALVQTVYLAAFLPSGALSNLLSAGKGLIAGLRGQTGRPDRLLKAHVKR